MSPCLSASKRPRMMSRPLSVERSSRRGGVLRWRRHGGGRPAPPGRGSDFAIPPGCFGGLGRVECRGDERLAYVSSCPGVVWIPIGRPRRCATLSLPPSRCQRKPLPHPHFHWLRLVVADENTAVPSESRRTDDPEVANSSPTTGSITTLTVWPQSGLLGASQ